MRKPSAVRSLYMSSTLSGSMVEFDGRPISNLNDYAYALRSKKPGDMVAVVVKRNGQDVKTDVTLEARR